jgi:hypothetical protein
MLRISQDSRWDPANICHYFSLIVKDSNRLSQPSKTDLFQTLFPVSFSAHSLVFFQLNYFGSA